MRFLVALLLSCLTLGNATHPARAEFSKSETPSPQSLVPTTVKQAILQDDLPSLNKLLASQGLSPEEQEYALFWAIHYGRHEMLTPLIRYGAIINPPKLRTGYGSSPLMDAAERGELAMVKYLIAQGARIDAVNINWWSAIYYAAQNGHLEVVKFLVAQGSPFQTTALLEALDKKQVHVAEYLIHQKVDLSKPGLMRGAIFTGYLPLVKTLQAKGVPLQSNHIYNAIASRYPDMLRYLISQGLSVSAQSADKTTPVHLAIQVGDMRMLALLAEAGADLVSKDASWFSPLVLACRQGHPDMIAFLLKRATYDDIDLALSQAIQSFETPDIGPITFLLLVNDADPNQTDKWGKNAFDYALESPFKERLLVLLEPYRQ